MVKGQADGRLSLPTGSPDFPPFNTRALEVSRRRGTHRRGALIGVKTHGNGKAKLSLGNGQISLGAAKIMGNMGFLAGTKVKSIYNTFKRCCFGGLYTLSPLFSNLFFFF